MRRLAPAPICGALFLAFSAPRALAAEPPETEPPQEPEWAREIRRKLERKVSFEFKDTPLTESVTFLQTLTKVNMIFDPEVAEDKGAEAITLKVTNKCLDVALRRVLTQAGLAYKLMKSAVLVSTPERIAAMRRQEAEARREAASLLSAAAPAGGHAVVVPVTALTEHVAESDLACLCTVEAFRMIPGTMQPADSPFGASVGLLRVKVLQPFRMEGKGVLKKAPAYLDAIAATRLGLRRFRKGEHYLLCFRWDPLLKQILLPEELAMTGDDAYLVPADVVATALKDPGTHRIVDRVWRHRDKTDELERLASAMTYLVRFYRHLLKSNVVSVRLEANEDMYDPVPGHSVYLSLDTLVPDWARRFVDDHHVPNLPPTLRKDGTRMLIEAGFLDEWAGLAEVINEMAERCRQEDVSQDLREYCTAFAKDKEEWLQWLKQTGSELLPATEGGSGP